MIENFDAHQDGENRNSQDGKVSTCHGSFGFLTFMLEIN
jgi:transcriptional regulator GlxA family with amidase domain